MNDDPETPKSGEEEKEPRSPVEGWPQARKAKVEEPPTTTRTSAEGGRPRAANLRHTQRGRFTVDGPSGTRYAFGSHGTLKVKGEDVEALLAIKRVQRTCCGPRAPQVLYPLVLA